MSSCTIQEKYNKKNLSKLLKEFSYSLIEN
jgi:hypothetical protein